MVTWSSPCSIERTIRHGTRLTPIAPTMATPRRFQATRLRMNSRQARALEPATASPATTSATPYESAGSSRGHRDEDQG